jgi:hypothetical protein
MLIHYGWPFLIAGLMLIAATVLLPAQSDLRTALWQRDKALAAEQHAKARLDRYESALAAIDRGDPVIAEKLRVSVFGERAPREQRLLPTRGEADTIFRDFEPPPPAEPILVQQESLLATWALGDRSRLWLIAAAGLCILIGVMPPATDEADTSGDEA